MRSIVEEARDESLKPLLRVLEPELVGKSTEVEGLNRQKDAEAHRSQVDICGELILKNVKK